MSKNQLKKQSKNYIGFVNDHSGSMSYLATAATKDYNATIQAIKGAADREMMDTVVSVVGVGLGRAGHGTERQVVISNPHVLKPITDWPTPGATPLYDGIGDMIELFQSLPDAGEDHVSCLIIVTTDGEEAGSRKYDRSSIKALIAKVQATGSYDIVFRVPKGATGTVSNLGVPAGNIQEWETTVAGMAASTKATTAAVDTYFATRATGQRSSGVFYANAAGVTAKDVKATMENISAQVQLFVVPAGDNGIEIKPFVERVRNGAPLMKGSAFYQLTKTEARVQDTKLILIRDRLNGHVYHGPAARQMLGLSTVGNIRLHPGDHGNFDIFIQSTSVNRKLVAGTGVIYWAAVGTAFTAADLAYLSGPVAAAPVVAPAQPTGAGVTVLAAVTPTNKPTKSPLVPTPKAPAVRTFPSREDARAAARLVGKSVVDNGKAAGTARWSLSA